MAADAASMSLGANKYVDKVEGGSHHGAPRQLVYGYVGL